MAAIGRADVVKDGPVAPATSLIELASLSRPERTALRTLVIRAVATAGRSNDIEELERLVRDAPIAALPGAAVLHRIAGSVLRGLDGVDGVPTDVCAQLAAVQHRSSLRHLLLTGALGEIAGAFDDAGLSWVVMKGPAVAAMLYPEVTDRSYGDLDLLVARRHFADATRILEGLGYEHTIRNWDLAERMMAGQVGMTRQAVAIDLHWHLHYSSQDRRPYAFQPETMLGRNRHVSISGVVAPTFDAVDTLITLAFHAARSDGHRLVWLKDLERALAVDEPDLDELVRRCRVYRCAPSVGVMLARARSLLDARVPGEITTSMTPPLLRMADNGICLLSHPIQLHDRPTLARVFTRSIRSSFARSVAAVPARCGRQLRRRVFPPRANETDHPLEKRSYLTAVAGSAD